MSDLYGPTLPPGFTAAQSEEDATTEQKPSVPKPELPTENKREDTSSGVYGPALPPGLATGSSTRPGTGEAAYGPLIPSGCDVIEPDRQKQQSGERETAQCSTSAM